MRKPIIAGNWKMYKSPSEAKALAEEIKNGLDLAILREKEVVLCPPAIDLPSVREVLADSEVALGAQNLYPAEEGAYTGEISPAMLKEAGVSYVIIGHSERRQYFRESDDFINRKVIAARKHGLNPILCIGETLEQREAEVTERVLEEQLSGGLKDVIPANPKDLVIAYEPIWAIGTGKTATTGQAQAAHLFIREFLAGFFEPDIADQIRIQYGGSVKPENIAALMAQPDIDGALVGGASLTARSFLAIIQG